MKKLFLLLVFMSFVSCIESGPVSSQEEDVELLGWMDIEYIVIGTGPSLMRIGRSTEPNKGAITFLSDSNSWSEIIRMPIRKKDRLTLSTSLDEPGGIGNRIKATIIARGIVIATGESNLSVVLSYIF